MNELDSSPPAPAEKTVAAKAKEFFETTQTPRWHTYVVTLLGMVATFWMTQITDGWKRADDYRVQQLRALSDSMTQFQVHASAYAMELMDTKQVPVDAKRALLANLNEQYARARAVKPLVGDAQKKALDSYCEAILNMQNAIDATNDVVTLGRFWTAASKLLVTRNKVNDSLRNAI
ncbi:hypothetical protein K9U39_06940 [Rhodoblastus acidophilus]|uniref:Uncharacterized protein n=1 Tax=Candidatus Rhodoblastus alkanivorans TaxID=2954117 RepID=A0ABS9Z6Y3_9HYPH|nr:hypothetical protein [Candidatus Rhodoblastus alkanivorans]MCI4680119.1 hypothetical protein [Candidatus Rhodoblastus alkanivorans]MCI4683373.1 hypothetical protein [Candidatus Rhodoblastus alkanivorans]MDI4640683.1 hypothetical protein [Rhodoblastus acidophilus]